MKIMEETFFTHLWKKLQRKGVNVISPSDFFTPSPRSTDKSGGEDPLLPPSWPPLQRTIHCKDVASIPSSRNAWQQSLIFVFLQNRTNLFTFVSRTLHS